MNFKIPAMLLFIGCKLFAQEQPIPKSIAEIDSNFKTAELGGVQYKFFNPTQAPFVLSGFAWYGKEHKLCRLPESILPNAGSGVASLAWHTSGGMLRFKTDSKTIALKVKLLSSGDMSHMPRTGSSGFDIYMGTGTEKRFVKIVMPKANSDTIETSFRPYGNGMREFTINFPLYNGIKTMDIGVEPSSNIEAPTPFKYNKPVLFYGSSITQGGCASRPGNDYPHILGRWLDAEIINLGFSGNAKGEPVVAEAIASLDLTAFVMDYDHNAPSFEHLEKTHEAFFKIIRGKHPELPIIIITKPDVAYGVPAKRTEIIRKTYDNAIAAGDKNVYFVDGQTLFGTADRDSCTVDGCHPNDLGFMRMAENIYPTLKKAIHAEDNAAKH